ncbi:hypothetical protein RhiirA4_485580 [Rhizophagus irregularis]|uniref:Uncharacterized protein n=1 Tax=Rhizophagus irregularis TaxID=588596 RepID=A0A2I1HQB6_9GLOM|nr:hypothetical protein RhiirA4_485580 [Rhizophagus irregularis]
MSNLYRNISEEKERMKRACRIQQQHEERLREYNRNEEFLQSQKKLKENADYFGTNYYTLRRRKLATDILTHKSDYFHTRMTDLTKRLNGRVDVALNVQLRKEMETFETFFTHQTSQGTQTYSDIAKEFIDEVTSDDTKELERRPRKRNDASLVKNFFSRNEDRYKRNRPSEESPDYTASRTQI